MGKALDVLQGQNYMYYGIYMPTIDKLINQLEAIDISPDDEVFFLWDILLRSVKKRFPNIYSEENLKAALLHPCFRNSPCFSRQMAFSKQQLISNLATELSADPAFSENVENQHSSSYESFLVII